MCKSWWHQDCSLLTNMEITRIMRNKTAWTCEFWIKKDIKNITRDRTKKPDHKITIMQLIVSGIIYNKTKLVKFLETHHVNIANIHESRLTPTDSYEIKGYSIHMNDKTIGRLNAPQAGNIEGGVVILIKGGIPTAIGKIRKASPYNLTNWITTLT